MRWTLFVAAWTTGMAYGLATLVYQAANYAHHPAASLAWIAGISVAFALVLFGLRRYGQRDEAAALAVPQNA
jgi:ferrous iron transport protein B